jgi:adenine-specific DNA-methyltransferase
MDYIKTTACARLQKVIEGEQGGISQSVNWHGGGSFVYCELATANQRFVDTIEAATTTEQLKNIWSDMQATGFLSWKVKPQEIDENISDFAELTLDDQKRFLIECLDKNLLYVPYSEINNQEFGISEDEKNLNSDFYSIV